MSQESKPRNNPARSSSKGGTLLGVFIGLVLGVGIAAGVVWYINKTPLPFQKNEQKNEPRTESRTEKNDQKADGVPLPLPGKPGDKPQEKLSGKPRFDFYKILPGTEEAAPQTAPTATRKPSDPQTNSEALALQVGAFQNPTDADNLKARLALMGVEASVQQVTVPEKGVMHRVRIGPYRSPEDMNKVRSQLAQNGIQATVVKIKDGALN